jgi:hypothetical protein
VAEEGRLGQDLDVEELRDRLERDPRELIEAVEPAGRVNVDDGHGEEDFPGEPARPAPGTLDQRTRAPADGVVALVDRR